MPEADDSPLLSQYLRGGSEAAEIHVLETEGHLSLNGSLPRPVRRPATQHTQGWATNRADGTFEERPRRALDAHVDDGRRAGQRECRERRGEEPAH